MRAVHAPPRDQVDVHRRPLGARHNRPPLHCIQEGPARKTEPALAVRYRVAAVVITLDLSPVVPPIEFRFDAVAQAALVVETVDLDRPRERAISVTVRPFVSK